MLQASFKEVFKGGLKHINSLPKKVCFVVVVCQSSQLPEQKEGLFFTGKQPQIYLSAAEKINNFFNFHYALMLMHLK